MSYFHMLGLKSIFFVIKCIIYLYELASKHCFFHLSWIYLIKSQRQNQNIFQNDYFRKFSENLFGWVHQVAIREPKKTINSIAIDSLLNIRPNYLITYMFRICSLVCKSRSFLPSFSVHTEFLVLQYLYAFNDCTYSYIQIAYV